MSIDKKGLRFVSLLFIGILFPFLCGGCNFNNVVHNNSNFELTILHTNDTHGRVNYDENNKAIGFSRIAAYSKKLKAQKNVLLVDAGDTLHGQPVVALSKGKTAADILGLVGYDYFTPGNHDFDYGFERLVELRNEMPFKTLAANVYYRESSLFNQHDIYECDGAKIGIFGLVTPETSVSTNQDKMLGIEFRDPIAVAKEQVALLQKAGADFVVAITHLGIEPGFVSSYELRDNVSGIDLIIDGHSHTKLQKIQQVEGRAVVAEAGSYSEYLGVVDISVKNGQKSIVPRSISFEEFPNDIYDDVNDYLTKLNEELAPILNQVIGYTNIDLDGTKASILTRETVLSKIAVASVAEHTKADIVLLNGGGFKSSIKKGNITMSDVLSVFPFENHIVTKSIKGQDIISSLENGFKAYPAPAGAFSQIWGLTCVLNSSANAGSRVEDVKVGGSPIKREKEYVVAMNDFMANGGDLYSMLKEPEELKVYWKGIDEMFIEYVQKNNPIQKDIWSDCITIK